MTRNKRDEARKLINEGIDPTEKKRSEKAVCHTENTFKAVALRWHASNKKWYESHRDNVLNSLETYVFPLIGSRDITSLESPDLILPVKAAKEKGIYEIASRLQQRIKAIMCYAAQSRIIKYNPAGDMAGALTTVKSQHRPALRLDCISDTPCQY